MAGESQQQPHNEPDPTVITTEIISKEITHLREKLEARIAGLDQQLVERDRRYTERFEAQQLAVKEAFERAEGAVAAAFDSSEKAILKAEVSIEKRADATYVSLQELSNKLADLMPRQEAEARIGALAETVVSLGIRVERIEAVKTGGEEQRNAVYAFVGFLATALILVTVLAANGVFSR